MGAGPVGDVGCGRRRRRLVGTARAVVDVPAGYRVRCVGVDGVLVGLRDPERPLLRVRLLDPELEAARPAATGEAAVLPVLAVATVAPAAATEVLVERLVLVGLRLVRDVRRGCRGGRLIGARVTAVDVSA